MYFQFFFPRYVKSLFQTYADTYDDHLRKKLLYSAPQAIRKVNICVELDLKAYVQQAVKDVYNSSFIQDPTLMNQYDGNVLAYLNGSLDVLDLGCGTGLLGAWLADYAKSMVCESCDR